MKRIIISILVLFCSASCAVRKTSNVLTTENQASMEKKVLLYVNEYRNAKNMSPLISSEPLAQLARAHSIGMQRNNKIDHHGFSGRVSKVRNQYPRTYVAENVGFNHGYSMPEKRMVDSWIKSPGHRVNILGNYRHTGIGITQSAEGKIFFTQLFVSP